MLPRSTTGGGRLIFILYTRAEVDARQRNEVHPTWPQESCDRLVSRPLSDDSVDLPGKSTRSFADFAGAEQLDSSKPHPKLVECSVCALDPNIAAGIVLMQIDGHTFCFLGGLNEGDELGQSFSSPTLQKCGSVPTSCRSLDDTLREQR
jgi:hypothetical protein